MSHRTRLSWLALFCVACAAYGSFVPLRWRPLGWTEGFRLAVAMPVEPVWHLFNGDFFTNVLVFLPIGFFAAGAIARGRRPAPVLAVTGTVLTGSAVLSMLIELGQVFVRDRTPSWSDVYAQTLGGLAGAVLWTLIGVASIEWVTRALRESSREERVLRLLGLYAAGWTALGLATHGVSASGASAVASVDGAAELWAPCACRTSGDRDVVGGPSRRLCSASEHPAAADVGGRCAGLDGRWIAGPDRSRPTGQFHAG